MIDIHAHILPCVDDGSEEYAQSLEMLKNSVQAGVTDIILTPHYRGRYVCDASKLRVDFLEFKQKVASENIPVNLYLGQEVALHKGIKKALENGENLTLNDTKFVLLELDYEGYADAVEEVYELKRRGYIPVLAHIERFPNVSVQDVVEIKSLGGYIQVNAGSIANKDSRTDRKKVKKLFKLGLVDFVASDIHSHRTNYMAQAYEVVKNKYGEDTANAVFNENAKKIIQG